MGNVCHSPLFFLDKLGKHNFMMSDDVKFEAALEANFIEFWPRFLALNIFRNKKMVQLAGSGVNAMVMQVVYWHELMILKEGDMGQSYDEAVALIQEFGSVEDMENFKAKKLTVSLISEMISVPYETTRRHITELTSQGLLIAHERLGFVVNKDTEFHQLILSDLNSFEKKMVLSQTKLMNKFISGNDG